MIPNMGDNAKVPNMFHAYGSCKNNVLLHYSRLIFQATVHRSGVVEAASCRFLLLPAGERDYCHPLISRQDAVSTWGHDYNSSI